MYGHVCETGGTREVLPPLLLKRSQTQRGPRGVPSPRICMFLGGMKVAFVLSHSLGPWRARRLNSADVDSRDWLASTQTYIAFAVLFMVYIHSGLGG